MPERRTVRRYLHILNAAFAVLCVWLAFKYALPWLMPFLIAFLISRLIEPVVALMTRRLRIPRSLASAFCTVLVFGALIALGSVIIGRIVFELSAFIKDLPALFSDLGKLLSALGDRLDEFIAAAPLETQEYLRGALEGIQSRASEIPGAISARVPGIITSIISGVPRLLLFVFTCAVSAFFISSGYREVTAFIMRQIPERGRAAVYDFKSDLYATVGKWAKAQLMLSGVTFVELCVAFLLLRIDFAVLLALIVAVLDALPIIGTGTILIPWSVISLLSGEYRTGVMLIVTYGLIYVVRNILEPKLIGGQLGLSPIATLLCLYIGFRAMGVVGMVLFPIGLIMVKQLNDRGYLCLWK